MRLKNGIARTHKMIDACDGGCWKGDREVKRLELGGGSGVNLCESDWNKEMRWRRLRNEEDLEPQNYFDIIAWSDVAEG